MCPVVFAVVVSLAGVDAPVDRVDRGDRLAPYAEAAHDRRLTGGFAYLLTAAGMIGAGITYVAVANLDGALGTKEGQDTVTAGLVLGAASVAPAALGVANLVVASPAEDARASLAAGKTTDEVAAELTARSASDVVVRVAAGAGFIAAGLGSAALGGYFLALPHIYDVHRSIVTHSTGAELIGLGVASVGVGIAAIALGDDDDKLAAALH